jgi:hypothetical protein
VQQYEMDSRITSTWSSLNPCSDIVLLTSPYLNLLAEEVMGTRIELFFDKVPKAFIINIKDNLVVALQRLSHYYGPTQTQGVLRYVNSPRNGWGYSRSPLIVVPEAYALTQLDQEFGRERIFHGIVHELAHFWWSIADTSSPDDWINEGLAEYSAFRLSEELYGKSFTDLLGQEYQERAFHTQTGMSIAETTGSSDDRYVNRYEKTTLMLIEARHRYGHAQLDHIFHILYQRFIRTADATTQDFLEVVQQQLGSNVKEFFCTALNQREWINPQELP